MSSALVVGPQDEKNESQESRQFSFWLTSPISGVKIQGGKYGDGKESSYSQKGRVLKSKPHKPSIRGGVSMVYSMESKGE